MQQSATLIFNPVAGQGDSEAELAEIQERLANHFELTTYCTTIEESAFQLTQFALESGADIIIASGGDGTLSEVAGALLKSKVPLGIISRGTANAFASALNIPTDIAGACDTIISGQVGQIDVGSCNGYPLLLLAGIGLEAETIEGADRASKDRFGTFAYILSALQQLKNLSAFEVELETEDRIISCSATAITIANAAPATSVLAQGPAQICYDDGLLDVTIFAPTTALRAMVASYNLLQSAFANQAADHQDVGYFKVDVITIRTDPPQKVVVDGELTGMTPIRVESIPKGLSLILPSKVEQESIENLIGLPGLEIEYKQ